jgi:hypothetical protein
MARDKQTEINITFDENLVNNYEPRYPQFQIVYYIINEEGELEYNDYDYWFISQKDIMIEEIKDGYVENSIFQELDEDYPIVKVVLFYVENNMEDGREIQVLYDVYD